MTPQRKMVISLGLLATLALLAWRQMEPGRWQQFTWIVLGFFAFRVVIEAVRARYDGKRTETDVSGGREQKG